MISHLLIWWAQSSLACSGKSPEKWRWLSWSHVQLHWYMYRYVCMCTHSHTHAHSLCEPQYKACLFHLRLGSLKVAIIILTCWLPAPAMVGSLWFLNEPMERSNGEQEKLNGTTVSRHLLSNLAVILAKLKLCVPWLWTPFSMWFPWRWVDVHSLSRDAFSGLPFPMACRTEKIILGFTDSVIGELQRLILQTVADTSSFPCTAYVYFPLKST